MKKETSNIYKICQAGVFSALIAVCTFALRFPIASGQGYIHTGDALVYLSGVVLGGYGIFASAIGGALSDIISGFPIWALPTAVIKGFNVLPFLLAKKLYRKKRSETKIINLYTFLASVVSGFITVFGYALAEVFLYSKEAAVADILPNTIQAISSLVLFLLLGSAVDKIKR